MDSSTSIKGFEDPYEKAKQELEEEKEERQHQKEEKEKEEANETLLIVAIILGLLILGAIVGFVIKKKQANSYENQIAGGFETRASTKKIALINDDESETNDA